MYIKIQATPSAKKEMIIKESEDTFLVYVKEPPRGGAANRRIIEMVSAIFPPPVRIVSGHHSRNKILSVGGK